MTQYPSQLSRHLFEMFGMKPGQTLLEVGCGRGEFLNGFGMQGMKIFGCDSCESSKEHLPGVEVKICDVENGGLPYPDNSFDVVYSKSLLEHLHHPDKYLREVLRVLKEDGLCITMVPDWEVNFQTYFDDYTHRTPFTFVSLSDIYKIVGFDQVNVTKFRQLPIVWKYPALNLFCRFISPAVPVRTKNKFLRWSRELMLLGSGRKPKVC